MWTLRSTDWNSVVVPDYRFDFENIGLQLKLAYSYNKYIAFKHFWKLNQMNYNCFSNNNLYLDTTRHVPNDRLFEKSLSMAHSQMRNESKRYLELRAMLTMISRFGPLHDFSEKWFSNPILEASLNRSLLSKNFICFQIYLCTLLIQGDKQFGTYNITIQDKMKLLYNP